MSMVLEKILRNFSLLPIISPLGEECSPGQTFEQI
jgi:hypothetical protein